MVGLLGSLHAEERGAFQYSQLKVIFSNIVSILINYPERLSKLLFEYFMAFHVNISRTKCCTLLFNNASSVRIYLWNLCSVLQTKRGTDLESHELLADTRVKMWSIPQHKEYLSISDFQLEMNKINSEIDQLHFLRIC